MYMTTRWGLPYWATLLVALPAGALMLRLFIFFHDCCHGSYLSSELGMKIIGNILGVLTFTPTRTGDTPTACITARQATWTAAGWETCGQ